MGFRQAAVLCSIAFFLGVLFINFNVDHRVLYQPLTEKSVQDGFDYYSTFYRAPLAVKALLHTLMGVGVLSLISKFTTWNESAVFFDGSSIALYMCAIILYMSVGIPSIRTVVDPLPDVDTREDRIEALRVLAAANTLIALCLFGTLGLQAGQEYAKRSEAAELRRVQAEARAREEPSKKDQ